MKRQTLTNIIEEHIASQQRPSGLPVHETDQINAAALDGASFFDSLSSVGHRTGTFGGGPVSSRHLFDRLAERYGDPLTGLHPCRHLATTPSQPRFVHGAAPDQAFCKSCFKRFLRTGANAMRRYAASTDCDACGEKNEVFHPANISNGMATYIVNVCARCLPPGA